MNIRVKGDTVTIEGYVNAVERDSKILNSRLGRFVERIAAGAFGRALERNDDVRILLNHNRRRDLGGTKDGTLKLREDSIGLRAKAKITDAEVAEKSRAGKLVGWSFGYYDREGGVEMGQVNDLPLRYVRDLDLKEVSVLDDSKIPAYDGTLIETRDDGAVMNWGETYEDELDVEVEETRAVEPEKKTIDYSAFEKMIAEMKGEK